MEDIRNFNYRSEKSQINYDDDNYIRAKLTLTICYFSIGLFVISLLIYIYEIDLFNRVLVGNDFTLKELDFVESLKKIIYILKSLTFLGFITFFMIWFYNIYKNLYNIDGINLIYYPSTAIWWLLVPIFSVFKKFTIVKEIQKRYIDLLENNLENYIEKRKFTLYIVWLIFLFFSVSTWFFFSRYGYVGYGIESMIKFSIKNIIFTSFTLIFLIVSIVFIRTIQGYENRFVNLLISKDRNFKLKHSEYYNSLSTKQKSINGRDNVKLENNKSRAGIVILVSWITIIIMAFSILSNIIEFELINRVSEEDIYSFDEIENTETRKEVIEYFVLFFDLCLIVFFIRWFYNAYYIVHNIENLWLKYKPKMAIWAFLIPFINLVRPYKIAKEIVYSNITLINKKNISESIENKNYLILFWWIVSISSNIISYLFDKWYYRIYDFYEYITFSRYYIVTQLLDIISIVSMILFVRYVSNLEDKVYNLYLENEEIEEFSNDETKEEEKRDDDDKNL